MKSLIILAHGSRRKESNLEIKDLTEAVKKISCNEYGHIEYAYLELAEPSLPEAIDNSVKIGALNITVFPYFLNSGSHVTQDIPEIIKTAKDKYPGCIFNITACIGMLEDMPKLILEHVNKS